MKTTRPIFPIHPHPFTTERLVIRPYLPSDAEDMFVLRSQPEVMKWTSSKVPDADIAKTREWMASALPPLKGDTFRFAIEERPNPGKSHWRHWDFLLRATGMWIYVPHRNVGERLCYGGAEGMAGGLLGLAEKGGYGGKGGSGRAWRRDRKPTC